MHHFAVVAKSDSLLRCQVPEKSVAWLVDFFVVNVGAAIGVSGLHRLFVVVGHVCGGGPYVSLRTDFGVGKETIKQSETQRERVMIRRDVLSEEDQAGIAIAFFQIAEYLIISAVLFDDVDHVL